MTQYRQKGTQRKGKCNTDRRAPDLALELPVDADYVNNLFLQLQGLAHFRYVHHAVELFLQALESTNNKASQLALYPYPPSSYLPYPTLSNTSHMFTTL